MKRRYKQASRLDAVLRAPRREQPNIERLREALTQRAAQWKADLRTEPKVARLLLRRLVEIRNVVVDVAAVPQPGMLSLPGVGSAYLFARRRRNRG